LEQIAKHEIGHVLGLGHANFDGNLMAAAQINRGTGSVSGRKVQAVYTANEWWFEKPSGANRCIPDSQRPIT
jgi:predicted Zn-dependent protease